MIRWQRVLLVLILCGLAGYLPAGSASLANPAEGFLDTLARDTWAYLHSDQTTAHHLPYSWWSASLPGGDYANPAEIGLYALSWLAAYDLGRPWSPSWTVTEAELHAILDQLRAWQTASQAYQPHGPNAYANAVFYREMNATYGRTTITPATQAQIAYAADRGYPTWGLSDCFDVGAGGYVQQGAPPAPSGVTPETRPGLVTPHASSLALITPLAADAPANLQAMAALFPCAYDPQYGFRDSVMANPAAPDYGQCSDRFSALAQEWLFLALVNHESGFIWRYFYRDPGVVRAHVEMNGGTVYLPLVVR
jgi:hypothetical protein